MADGGGAGASSAASDAASAGRARADWPAPGETVDRATGRWRAVGAVALVAAALGVLTRTPGLLLGAAVAAAFGGYAAVASPPPVALAVERRVDDPRPDPGDEVTVTLTVRNAGDATLADLRLFDGVPARVGVTDGPARLATALRPGASATVTYDVVVPAGEHTFEPALAVARDPSGARERATRVAAATTLAAEPPIERETPPPPVRRAAGGVGRAAAAVGRGVEFHSVREYRPGDPPARVDWHRLARTGEVTTATYREERAAAVVVVVDARPEARVAPGPDAPTAVERGVEAAAAAYAALAERGDRVGVTTLSPDPVWLKPGAGRAHRERARELLAGVADADGMRADGGSAENDGEAGKDSDSEADGDSDGEADGDDESTDDDTGGDGSTDDDTVGDRTDEQDVEAMGDVLARRLPGGVTVVLVTPAVDDAVVGVARRLSAAGTPVSVVSPDPTDDATTGRLLARLRRRERLARLRDDGLSVVDWGRDEPLATALVRAGGRP